MPVREKGTNGAGSRAARPFSRPCAPAERRETPGLSVIVETDSPQEGDGFELPVPRATQGRPKAIIVGFGCVLPSLDYLRLPSVDISEGGLKEGLGTEAVSCAELGVRIQLPPGASLRTIGPSGMGMAPVYASDLVGIRHAPRPSR